MSGLGKTGLRIINNRRQQIALITPVRPQKSKFVRETVELLQLSKAKVKGTELGQFNIRWEPDITELVSELTAEVGGLPSTISEQVDFRELTFNSDSFGVKILHRWLEEQSALRGTYLFTSGELVKQISTICQHIRAFRIPSDSSKYRAMTIHQAKNQEFDGVVLLWPYEVRGEGAETNSRLLYNAVTRAKKWCLVLVQDSKGTRVSRPPFYLQ